MNTEGIDWSQVDRVKYQEINTDYVKRESEYKKLCFHHLKNIQGGEETRKKSPYFLINMKTSVLNEDTKNY